MMDLGKVGGDLDLNVGPVVNVQIGSNAQLRPHEIYENTTYIPNS